MGLKTRQGLGSNDAMYKILTQLHPKQNRLSIITRRVSCLKYGIRREPIRTLAMKRTAMKIVGEATIWR